ncbi:MAG: GH36-type glycosyl hydrolase domain-containing protein [Gemmatimonadaceae bacterium]
MSDEREIGSSRASVTSPDSQILSNGRYTVRVTGDGAGYSIFDGYALTRWSPDRTRETSGFWLYVRDVDSGAYWSAAREPVPGTPVRYDVLWSPGCVSISREEDGIESVTELCVSPEENMELRRSTLTNHGDRARRIEITSYAEVVLNTPAGDAGHPAFSKLFVQTEFIAEHQALFAQRRLRSPDDEPLWLVHTLQCDGSDGEVQWETDRARFIGRWRTCADPLALCAGNRLSGTVGNVLDPIVSLRRVLELGPGESAHLVAMLGVWHTREDVHSVASRSLEPGAVEGIFRRAEAEARRAQEVESRAREAEEVEKEGGGANSGADASGEGGTQETSDAGPEDRRAPLRHPFDAIAIQAPRGAPPLGAESMSTPPTSQHPSIAYVPLSTRSQASTTYPRYGRNEQLRVFNGFGGFTEDGSEYVIRIEQGDTGPRPPPLPWVNVVANEQLGFIATDRGAGYTWSVNSRENRLTPWANDPVTDPFGEALYIRDEDDGVFWSPTPGPVPGDTPYEVRHGFGYTRYRHMCTALEQEVTQFVPRFDSVKITTLSITNRGDRPRRLSIFSCTQLVLGVLPHESGASVVTEHDVESGAILAVNRERKEFAERVAFANVVRPLFMSPVQITADRTAFIGRAGTTSNPTALSSDDPLDGRTGAGLDPCAAFRISLEIPPGETLECAFLLGEAESADAARTLLKRYDTPVAIAGALTEARAFWRDTLSAIRIETPSPAIDLMVNGWLAYQNLGCRMWGRSAFYQSGGAYGFRDQLQDAAALIYLDPGLTRRQILLHAAHQFVEGDVLHWWHPPASKGIRTRFSDDLLWLPYIAAFYLQTTGDESVLHEEARFVTARELEPDEDEVFLFAEDSGESASVYEHCCRAIDRSLTAGAHGLPLMGTGDWNDGMNRVGREGRGESVWLGFFLYHILADFIPICQRQGDSGRAARFRAFRTGLGTALNDGGWDGGWYRRAYYDNGEPLGSAQNEECRIDVIAQAWSVLSGAAPRERAEQALDAMELHLVSEEEKLIRLLTPAFDRTPHDPGYIKGYLPGVRENGGQYTHGALWAVRALAEYGKTERAAQLLEMLSPVSHAGTPEQVAVYQAEPYVIAADVYGVEPHVGRGGWTWYTGSAGWMYRVALESVLGFRITEGRAIELRPCIPATWPGFTIRWCLPSEATTYEIVVKRGITPASETHVSDQRATVSNGAVVIPIEHDGRLHHVEVLLGSDVIPRYEAR